MAFTKALLSFLALLVILLPTMAKGDDNLDTFYEKLCNEVECGKGTCVGNMSYPLNYICECEPGWKRTADEDDEEHYQFLPCVIPNCTLNYGTCQPAPPPVPEKENPYNVSAFDPCYWAYCGEGTCKRNGSYAHSFSCTCNSGFSNLLNYTYYPCYSQCTLGSDCSSLGIKVENSTSSPSSDTTGTGGNSQGTSILPGKFHWMIILLISMAIIGRK